MDNLHILNRLVYECFNVEVALCLEDLRHLGLGIRVLRGEYSAAVLVGEDGGFERADGKEMAQDELLPYDVNADVIKVEDEDYGIWYIDAMERPEVYEGKTVEMRVQVQRSPKMPPGMIIPGRKAMTCCEDDMTFIGYLCRLNQTKSKTLKRILNNEWVTLTAQIHSEYNEAYDKTMPILTAIRIEKSEPPKEQLVYF